jgi:hypothetical protein
LGAQESSMPGAYHLPGVPPEEAVPLSLLFAVVYYLTNFVVSPGFSRFTAASLVKNLEPVGREPVSAFAVRGQFSSRFNSG